MAAKKPGLDWACFLICALLGIFRMSDPNQSQMNWIRMEGCREAVKRYRLGPWIQSSFRILDLIWGINLFLRGGAGKAIFEKYYAAQNPQHPTVILAQLTGI